MSECCADVENGRLAKFDRLLRELEEPFEWAEGVEEPRTWDDFFKGSCIRISPMPFWKQRVGNMTVVLQRPLRKSDPDGPKRYGASETVLFDLERAQISGTPRLIIVVGPYWRFWAFITLPLVVFVPGGICSLLPFHHPSVVVLYLLNWAFTLATLLLTSLTDPGILPRFRKKPQGGEDWVFNDQADTFRPMGAVYDGSCRVVIEGFDHTCPWTGTGIGRNNFRFFVNFVVSVQILLYFSIFVLTAGILNAGFSYSYF